MCYLIEIICLKEICVVLKSIVNMSLDLACFVHKFISIPCVFVHVLGAYFSFSAVVMVESLRRSKL